MSIQVKNVSKRFHHFTVLDNVSLNIQSGELVALLGPSGSGKTTLLRIIAGLEFSDSGTILLDGKEAHTKRVNERNVGFVFQHYALFKHMTVFENVAFGLKVRSKENRLTEADIKHKVMDLLHLIHLEAFYDRYPHQLSGGQRQRIALVRALAVDPKVLLLDEPFGALDAKVRKELRRWMRRLHHEIRVTSVFVTHDQEEAMEVADRIVVMNNGKITQVGTPEEVWQQPANKFVYDFLGNYNEFNGWKDSEGNIHLVEEEVEGQETKIPLETSIRWLKYHPKIQGLINKIVPKLLWKKNPDILKNEKRQIAKNNIGNIVKLYVRPHEMQIVKVPDNREYVTAQVMHINPIGALIKLELKLKSGKLLQVETLVSVFNKLNIKKGDTLYVRPEQTKIFE